METYVDREIPRGTCAKVIRAEDMPDMVDMVGEVIEDTWCIIGSDPERYVPLRFPTFVLAFRLSELEILHPTEYLR